MRYIREIRERAGMSQHECALFIGVSRSLLSMAELGERELPAQAVVKLMELQKMAAQNDGTAHSPTAAELQSAITLLKKQQRKCAYRAGLVRSYLKTLQGFSTQRQRRRWIHQKMEEDQVFQEELQMSMLPLECNKQYKREKLEEKVLLELRAASLEAEANLAGKMMEQLELQLLFLGEGDG